MASHVDDIIRAGHDVKEALLIYESCIHGVIVTLIVEPRGMTVLQCVKSHFSKVVMQTP